MVLVNKAIILFSVYLIVVLIFCVVSSNDGYGKQGIIVLYYIIRDTHALANRIFVVFRERALVLLSYSTPLAFGHGVFIKQDVVA